MSTTNQPMHYLEATKHVVTIIYRVMLIAHLSEMLPDIPLVAACNDHADATHSLLELTRFASAKQATDSSIPSRGDLSPRTEAKRGSEDGPFRATPAQLRRSSRPFGPRHKNTGFPHSSARRAARFGFGS